MEVGVIAFVFALLALLMAAPRWTSFFAAGLVVLAAGMQVMSATHALSFVTALADVVLATLAYCVGGVGVITASKLGAAMRGAQT